MIDVGTLSKLRRMVRRDGVSVREAARRLRISRNTAARWLAEPEMVEPKYPPRVASSRLLDPFQDQLNLWLKADAQRGKRDRRSIRSYYEAIRAQWPFDGAVLRRLTSDVVEEFLAGDNEQRELPFGP